MRLRLLAALVAMAPLFVKADVLIGSWNIRHLGWNNDKDFALVAHVANHTDLLAVQELMDPAALKRLERSLEKASGESWSSMASHELGRSSYQEHYGFLWRDSEVEYASGAVVFLDPEELFAREPYSARFRDVDTGQEFAAATVHIVFGDGVSDRLPEIDALADYWQWLGDVYPGSPRLLMGDFNLSPDHPGWEALRRLGAEPAITDGRTTLGTTAGYASLYDNIWYETDRLSPSDQGILKFPALLPLDHVAARERVSDHAPVYIGLNGSRLTPISTGGGQLAADTSADCIDLNNSAASRLESLPHIGPARAEDIIEGRPWQAWKELTDIRGIGEGRLNEILDSDLLCNIDT